MELRQLKYAVKIAEEKNFSRAAEKLHIAQPSLSQQIAKLEKELGVRLFRRNTNSVEPTYAGNLFVHKAQKVLDTVEQMQKEMDDISQMRKGKLMVGSLPITGSHILPSVLPEFKKKYPNIDISLIEDTSAHLELLTATGQTDISLLSLPLQDQSLHYIKIIEEEIWLCVPPHHPLAQKHKQDCNFRVVIKDLRQESFIGLKKGQGFRQIAMDLCAEAGFIPKIVFESSNIDTIQSLVAAGMGIAFVPKMVARTEGMHLPVYLPIEGSIKRTLVIAYKKDRYLSKAAQMFMKTVKDVFKDVKS